MRWIADDDRERIEQAHELIEDAMRAGPMLPTVADLLIEAVRRLTVVQENIHALAQEQPNPTPRLKRAR